MGIGISRMPPKTCKVTGRKGSLGLVQISDCGLLGKGRKGFGLEVGDRPIRVGW
jgi:hypothetical protein